MPQYIPNHGGYPSAPVRSASPTPFSQGGPAQRSLFPDVGEPVPRQGNLFGGSDPGYPTVADARADRRAREAAEVYQRPGPYRPGEGRVPRQQSFDFQGSTRMRNGPTLMNKLGKAWKMRKGLGPLDKALELAFIPAVTIAGGISGSAQWGAPTGLSEDYVGGAVYGSAKGFGAGVGLAVGGIVGGSIGSIGGPLGTIAGSIVGSLVGERVGGALANSPARHIGMAARAIARTSRAVDRIQFGGNFVDSRAAYTMRQHAVQEMSGSMLNARQFLGNEAIFLHER